MYNLASIQTLSISDNVETIRGSAFYGCSGLTSVDLSNVDTIEGHAFYGCSGLTSIDLSNVDTIVGFAFSNCSSLTSVDLGNIKTIGINVFSDCRSLTSIDLSNVETIGNYAFYNCSSLTSIDLSNVETIGNYAFPGCSGLTTIDFGNVETIGNSAFYNCSSLTSIDLSNVETIGNYAFSYCSGLTSVDLSNVETIGNYAFSDCNDLISVDFSEAVSVIGDYAFQNCDKLLSVELGPSVNSVGIGAFYGCDSLKTVIWNNNAFLKSSNTLSSWTGTRPNVPFYQCSNLETFVFGDSVRRIPNDALAYMSTLKSLTIGANVGAIDNYAFYNCSNLDTIISYAQVPPIISNPSYAWYNTPTGTLVLVPCGSGNAYRTSPIWNRFTNINSVVLNNEINLDLNVNNVNYGDVHYNCDNQRLYATANYGYHFVQWSDGNTNNPRTIVNINNVSLQAIFAKNTYNIFITNNIRGVFTGAGQYEYLDTATISVVPNYGYSFVRWNDGDTNATRQVVVTANKTYTATFSTNSYTINVVSNDTTMGTVSGAGTYAYNTNRTITATPTAFEYYLLYWSDGSVANPRTIRVLSDTTYYAVFGLKPTYTLTVLSNNNAIGTVTGSDTAIHGTSLEISATATAYGYHFARWSDGNTQNPRTIQMLKDSTITAIFERNTYTLATSVNGGTAYGSVAGGGNHLYLDTVSITATPNYGYHFTSWNDGDTNNPRQVRVISDTTFTAVFDRNTYSLACNVNVDNRGRVSGAGNYLYRDNVSITATSNYGYHFTQWSDGNTQNPRTIRLERDTVFTAIFERNTYSISGAVNVQDRGSISGVGNYLYLDSVSVTANANYGYHFTQWSDGNTNNPRMIQITKDTTLTAVFDKNTYTVSSNANFEDRGTVTGAGEYLYKELAQILAVPKYGYNFVRWNDGNTQRSRVVSVLSDTSFTAIFEPIVYKITVGVAPGNTGRGTVVGGGYKAYKNSTTIEAHPYYGYHFNNWSDGNTDSIRTVEVLGNASYYAYFAPNQYTLNLSVADEAMGTVVGNGSYDYLTEVQIRANSKTGYFFSQWSDGNKDNPRTITLKRDTAFTAYFTDTYVGMEEAEELENLAFYPNPTEGTITFNNQEIKKVEVLDAMGRVVAVHKNSYIIDLSKLNKGLYTLRITLPQGVTIRKVVRK